MFTDLLYSAKMSSTRDEDNAAHSFVVTLESVAISNRPENAFQVFYPEIRMDATPILSNPWYGGGPF